MKRFLCLLLAGLVCFWPAGPVRAPEKVTVLECTVAILVLGTGALAVYGIWRMCQRLDQVNTNTGPGDWTKVAPMPAAAAQSLTNRVTLQSALTIGAWDSPYTFVAQPLPGALCVVAYRDGAPILTNTAPLVYTNGLWLATLDFTALPLTNGARFFRLANP